MWIDVEIWILVGILAVIAKSSYQSWQKYLTEDFTSTEITQSALIISSLLFTTVAVVLRPSLPPIGDFVLASVSGIFVSSGIYLFIKSMETTDLSVASPLQQTIPVFASIIEPIFLSSLGYEPRTIIAAVITTIGAYIVVIERGNILLPIKKLTEKGPLLALTTALFLAIASIIAHYTTQTMPVIYYVLTEVTVGAIFMTLVRRDVPSYDKQLIGYGFVLGLNLGLSILTLSLVVASQATVFFRISLIINVLVGWYFYKEGNILIRLFGSLIIISGVILTII